MSKQKLIITISGPTGSCKPTLVKIMQKAIEQHRKLDLTDYEKQVCEDLWKRNITFTEAAPVS